MLVLAAFSREEPALDWTREMAETAWGPVALVSERFSFDQTDYYATSMGSDLRKMFLAFRRLIDPAELARIKRLTNQWERAYRETFPCPLPRPLNLDPGYLTLGKLVLASTKDHAHRIYLADGIFAEVTLYFQHGQWRFREWTYPDYRRPEYHAFFTACRQHLLAHRHSEPV
jgi:hypothetical protein